MLVTLPTWIIVLLPHDYLKCKSGIYPVFLFVVSYSKMSSVKRGTTLGLNNFLLIRMYNYSCKLFSGQSLSEVPSTTILVIHVWWWLQQYYLYRPGLRDILPYFIQSARVRAAAQSQVSNTYEQIGTCGITPFQLFYLYSLLFHTSFLWHISNSTPCDFLQTSYSEFVL